MRIISGNLKGREILGFKIDGTRPTMDRIKESLFASIQDYIKDSLVLDLFAGSGNLGIEALSNGSKFVYFNDKNLECVKVIKRNLNNFNLLNKSLVLNLDYFKCLNYLKEDKIKFDLVFLDPPYKMEVYENILAFLIKNNLLNSNALVICEYEFIELKDNYSGLELIKNKKYGNKRISIYRRRKDE